MKTIPFEPLDPGQYRELVRRALAEDLGWGDVTTDALIDREQQARGVLLAKASCSCPNVLKSVGVSPMMTRSRSE